VGARHLAATAFGRFLVILPKGLRLEASDLAPTALLCPSNRFLALSSEFMANILPLLLIFAVFSVNYLGIFL